MLKQLYYKLRRQSIKFYLNAIYPAILERRAKTIGKKDKIEVVFFAMNLAMWRYQGVYELMSLDPRFNCHIVFTVPNTFSEEQIAADLQQMRQFFGAKGIKYEDYDEKLKSAFDAKGQINPDILFYPQPYSEAFPACHNFMNFKTKLICYVSYSINVIKGCNWLYDLPFHNLAWKVYCPLYVEKNAASKIAKNKGRNWVVSGYNNHERYRNSSTYDDPWKISNPSVKRIIWAPHFTIAAVSWLKPRSNFLWMANVMLNLADKFQGKLQIAFKPHPRLKSELYRHPEWGKDKTDRYYLQWANGTNTQLETGDFIDLFKFSDAMIHDCASFVAEYLYVNKPVAFVTQEFDALLNEHSDFGQAALNQHYILTSEEEILDFINQTVISGVDPKAEQRTVFFNAELKPQINASTSQVIIEDIRRSLGVCK